MHTRLLSQPMLTMTTLCERASRYLDATKSSIPFTVDKMDNGACEAYGAWPERLYVVLDGKIAFKAGKGPRGYKPAEVREWITGWQATQAKK